MGNPHYKLLSNLLSEKDAAASLVAVGEGGDVDWSAFVSDIAGFAQALKQHAGKRWILHCDDSYTFAVSFFALFCANKEVLLPPNKQRNTILEMEKHADGILSDFVNVTQLPHLYISADHVFARGNEKLPILDADRCILSLFTSGSEGEPKRIAKKLSQLETEVAELERRWGNTPEISRVWSTVSHQHIYGLLFKVLWPLAAGRPFTRTLVQYPEEFFQTAQSAGKAVLISSPAFLRALPPEMLRQLGERFSLIFSSGGPLDRTTAASISNDGRGHVIEVLGSTETGGIAFRDPAQGIGWNPFSGISVSRNDEGRLLIRSPYLESPEWYTTDDLVNIAESGSFELLGRADSVVKIQEKRVSLLQIEELLSRMPEIESCAALVIDSINLRRRQIACVVCLSAAGRRELESLGESALKVRMRDFLGDYLDVVVLPKKWRFVDNIALNSQGKRNHAALKELFIPVFDPQVKSAHLVSAHQQENEVQLQLRIPRNLGYFAGHFPDFPILPGIVQIDWALQFAGQYFQVATPVRRMKGLKFQSVIYPAQLVDLKLGYQAPDKRLSFHYSSDDRKHSSGTIFFQ